MAQYTLVLLRHGESTWNQANLFTGWTDVDLTEKGFEEARTAGHLLHQKGYEFDKAFTSVLTRAIRTLWVALDELHQIWIPVERNWRLNERHYGALQGSNKEKMAEKYGEDQVFTWRRSYDVPPPALDENDERHPRWDRRYKDVPSEHLPSTECLKDTLNRFFPYWEQAIAPAIRTGERVIISAHGNSLRALVKHLDGINDDEIPHLNIPTGVPLIYELDENLEPRDSYYLKNNAS